jgi:hypothetical protein
MQQAGSVDSENRADNTRRKPLNADAKLARRRFKRLALGNHPEDIVLKLKQ